jgi:hypothetical protein
MRTPFGDSLARADGDAGVAASAPGRTDHQVGAETDPFGVVAPKAVERAALQEHGRPDPRAVMDGEVLDIKNNTRILWRFSSHFDDPFFPCHMV